MNVENYLPTNGAFLCPGALYTGREKISTALRENIPDLSGHIGSEPDLRIQDSKVLEIAIFLLSESQTSKTIFVRLGRPSRKDADITPCLPSD